MNFTKFISYSLLPQEALAIDEQKLLDAAFEATQNAYAPYSDFHVGAAILLKNGEIYLGNNQENRAYPSGMCAERSALYYVGSLGKGAEISKIAVRARCPHSPVLHPITPCGSCRQVMLEYEELAKENLIILMKGESGEVLRVEGVRDSLMPFSFDAEF